MSLHYRLFGKITTIDDFITEARKRGLHDVEVAPLCYDNDIFKYDPNAIGKVGILHQRLSSINVWTTERGSDGYPQLYFEATKLRFDEEYEDGNQGPLLFHTLEEWDSYQAKINEKEQKRRNIEGTESLKLREKLVEYGFKVRFVS